ncbi:ADP-ribosylglycohydrolase family protein [Methylobacterium sp. Leaf102]|uniref:ADP-ribosylglycohydrolase family protein n=1 Tax=Methylobacterium sp. Leaf102 TaxID=1736253 RepID=UPI0009EB43DC|nr:ADP-ribosylglycohydrolase family protein [Methylobacterium sp. Leaf102]
MAPVSQELEPPEIPGRFNPLRIAEIEVGRHRGRLGITIAPGKRQPHGFFGPHERDLGVDLDAVAAWDAAAVVTLMEAHELARVGIAEIGTEVRRRHMEWHHVPIVDVSVPDAAFEAAWPALSGRLRSLITRGARVLVHCRGGLGRSGMLVARLLAEDGMDPREAIDAVRTVRPGAIETPAQEHWVVRGAVVPPHRPSTERGDLRDRAVGALVGLAVGDALGTTIEFTAKPRHAALDGIVGGGPFGLRPGQWTDDTAQALALGDSLAHDPRLDPRDLMDRFTAWYRGGEYSCTGACFDIGNATRDALDRYGRTGDPIAGSTSGTASGNGALMRLAPVAIRHWNNPEALMAVSDRQTRTTHGSPATVCCSRLLADMLAQAIAGASLDDVLGSPSAEAVEGGWRGLPRDAIEGSGYVVRSLQAAVWAVSRTTDFRSAVLLAANLGDDADTTAAIAGQLAGAVYGLSGIPEDWVAVLAWGDRIEEIAGTLLDATMSDAAPAAALSRFVETGEGVRVFRPGVGELIPGRGPGVASRVPDVRPDIVPAASEDPGAWQRSVNELVGFWSRLGDAHVHPDDLGHVGDGDGDFALDLHPVPWAGSLRDAKVHILFLNPGLSPDDAVEEARPAFKAALRANLRGDRPYPYLLTEHATHPGFRWARRTFGPDIVEADAPDICVLQLVPYHSKEGAVATRAARGLPSSGMIRRFVRDGILPRVRAGAGALIVARSAKLWGVTTEEPRVVVYAGAEPRRAFQTAGSRGGKLLREMLRPVP